MRIRDLFDPGPGMEKFGSGIIGPATLQRRIIITIIPTALIIS
jgi:hypothetical protein